MEIIDDRIQNIKTIEGQNTGIYQIINPLDDFDFS